MKRHRRQNSKTTLPSEFLLSECRLLSDRAAGAARRAELTREARPSELARDALDEIIDHFLRDIGHLRGQIINFGREVVVRPNSGDRDQKAECCGNKRLGDTTTDRSETT